MYNTKGLPVSGQRNVCLCLHVHSTLPWHVDSARRFTQSPLASQDRNLSPPCVSQAWRLHWQYLQAHIDQAARTRHGEPWGH